MENDLINLDPKYAFDREHFFKNVKNIMNIKYFNRIKQFMIRLHRNNLFLGHNYENKDSSKPANCYACNTHKQSRVKLMLNCSTTNKLLQPVIRILKKAGCLSNGCKIDMFLFDKYPVNLIENITLMFTWKYVYNSKFTGSPLTERPYIRAYEGLVAVIIQMSIPTSLIARNIIHILSDELKRE